MGIRTEAAQGRYPAPSSSSAACCTTRCSPPWACCTPRPPGTPATGTRGCASPTAGTTTTWASSRPCTGRPRLGITHILVLDASGDKADTWFTLGGSIALARSDAETEIVIDPMTMITPPKGDAPKLGSGEVVCPWASGTFTRRAPTGTGRDSTIVVCKLGWWAGAPWDVRAYAAGHPAYPADSTLEQLYDSAEFDAYRELGACSAGLAMRESTPGRRSGHAVGPSRRNEMRGGAAMNSPAAPKGVSTSDVAYRPGLVQATLRQDHGQGGGQAPLVHVAEGSRPG